MSCCERQRRVKSSEGTCDPQHLESAETALTKNRDPGMFSQLKFIRRLYSTSVLHFVNRKASFLTCRRLSVLRSECSLTNDNNRCDRLPLYANIPTMSWHFCFLFLILGAVCAPASSQTTVTNDFPSGCMFLQSSHRRMDKIIDDDSLVLAWQRLWIDKEDVVVRAYSCKSTGLSAIPKGLTAIAEAIYLDENEITGVKEVDLVPSTDAATTTSPTLALSLRSNQISSVESDAFRLLPELKLLVLKNNFIKSMQWTVSSTLIFQNLVELDLSMNQIEDFGSQEFGSFPDLKRLDLSGNSIKTLDGTILSKLPKLEHLDLSSNHITERALTPSDVAIRSLRFLSLAENFLGDFRAPHIAEFWRKLPELTTLDVSSNEISSGILPKEAFYGLSSVKTLNLSDCGIKKLEQGWINGGLSDSLKVLDLSNNLLQTISAYNLALQNEGGQNGTTTPTRPSAGEIMYENEIEVLFLNENHRLFRIEDDAFNSVPNLKLLFLQNCALRRFNFASTKYRYGADPIATTLPMLTNVWIFGNPIACDCYIRFIKEWSVSTVSVQHEENVQRRYIDAPFYTIDSRTMTISTEFAICASPESLAGVTIEAAPGKSMTCQEEPYSILVAMLIGPLTFAGSVALTVLCGSLHVCIARMKRGAVLSYHAREELMRNPKVRNRRSAPKPILSSFGWRHSHDDLSTYSTGSRSGRHTNLVLGNFEDHHYRRETQRARNRLSPEVVLTSSSPSFHVEERHDHSRTHSAGYCSGTDLNHQPSPRMVLSDGHLDVKKKVRGSGSDADSVLGKESVRTRSPSNDIPFIDEKGREENEKRSLGRISSSYNSSNNSSSASLLDTEEGAPTADRRLPGEELRLRKPVGRPSSSDGQKGSHHIPGLSSSGQPSSDETSL